KNQTNVRSATKDQTETMKRPRILTLEEALEFNDDDELLEVTPESIRMRKKILNKSQREKEAKRIKQLMAEDE
ncbi:translational GTPase TypA, partial [Bariatricus massiliensis]|nr:translational GTPase TypA [Bariatricus massiliensis]